MDFKKMAEIADQITAAEPEDAFGIINGLKHQYLLGLVTFVCSSFAKHKKVCDEPQCDFCLTMADWLDEEIFVFRTETHANIMINLAMMGDMDKWPFTDKEVQEKINEALPQIKAQMAQGDQMGVLRMAKDKPPKDKAH